jgi:hypothetical protein
MRPLKELHYRRILKLPPAILCVVCLEIAARDVAAAIRRCQSCRGTCVEPIPMVELEQ